LEGKALDRRRHVRASFGSLHRMVAKKIYGQEKRDENVAIRRGF